MLRNHHVLKRKEFSRKSRFHFDCPREQTMGTTTRGCQSGSLA
jgi:hypothetical protein